MEGRKMGRLRRAIIGSVLEQQEHEEGVAMRRVVVSLLLIVGQLLLVPTVSAANSGSIPAQVTMDAPCITIDSGTLDFGTKRFDQIGSLSKGFSLCHEVGNAYVYGSATNATSTGGALWTLVTTPVACVPTGVPDKYDIFAGVSPDANPPTSNSQLGSSPSSLWNAGPGPLTLWPNIHLPCEGSSGAGETMTFTIQLTTSFS
jgi:hypothetical protein